VGVVAGQISSKVWKTDIESAVDGIEVGGRNYVFNSDFSNEWDNWIDSSGVAGFIETFEEYPDEKFLRIDNSDSIRVNPFVASYTRIGEPGTYVLSWVQKGTGNVIIQNASENNANLQPRVEGVFTGDFTRNK